MNIDRNAMSLNINDTGLDFSFDPTPKAPPPSPVEKEAKPKVEETNLLEQILAKPKPKRKPRAPKEPKPSQDKKTNTSKDGEDKQALIMKLQRYASSERFKKYLKEMGFKLTMATLNKKSIKQLEELLARVRFSIANRGSNEFVDGFIQKGCLGLETVIHNRSKFKVAGTTQLLWQNEQFLDDLEAIKLEYLSFGSVDPKLRMAFTITRTAMTCHAINTDPRLAPVKRPAKTTTKTKTRAQVERMSTIPEANKPSANDEIEIEYSDED